MEILKQKDKILHDRGYRLFKFLYELSKLRTRSIKDISNHVDVLWMEQVCGLPGCYCIDWLSDEASNKEELIEIKKPDFSSFPPPPEMILEWLDKSQLNDSSIDFLPLKEYIEKIVEVNSETNEVITNVIRQDLLDHPEITVAWEEYIENEWWPWVEKDRENRKIHSIYFKLYSLYQMQQLSETYELNLMFGYLTWITPSGEQIKHHLLSSKINTSFELDKGIITVSRHSEGVKLSLEQDMLIPEERPSPIDIEGIMKILRDTDYDILHKDIIHKVLRAWVNSYPESQSYNETIIHQNELSSKLLVHFAPALVLRKRTERSIISLLEKISEDIKDEFIPIPEGIVDIIQESDIQRNIIKGDYNNCNDCTNYENYGEIYFPLPNNNEQRTIVQQLAYLNGVLVQGPPGTGKSHTIANLICHLLAKGNRVLVTSHTGKALEVLRKKLPKEISPLCVVATGEDTASRLALEKSVQEIADRYNKWKWNSSFYKSRINECQNELDANRKEEAVLLKKLIAIREAETYNHNLVNGVYIGTLSKIANQLREEESKFGWIKEFPDLSGKIPLKNQEIIQLLNLLRSINNTEIEESKLLFINPIELPNPEFFNRSLDEEIQAQKHYLSFSNVRERIYYKICKNIPESTREALSLCLLSLIRSAELLISDPQPWVKEVVQDVLNGREKSIRELLSLSNNFLKRINEKSQDALSYRITGLENQNKDVIKSQALSLLTYLQNGGSINFLTKLINKTVKESKLLIENIRINGCLCGNIDTLKKLLSWFEINECLDLLAENWRIYVILPESSFHLLKIKYEELCKVIDKCLCLSEYIKQGREIISCIPNLNEPVWHNIDKINEFIETLKAVKYEESLKNAQTFFCEIEERIKVLPRYPVNVHPALIKMEKSIKERDFYAYSEAYYYLQQLLELQKQVSERSNLLEKLNSFSPSLSKDLMQNYENKIWNERLSNLQAAWNWAHTRQWIEKEISSQRYQQLIDKLNICQNKISSNLEELAALKGWHSCLSYIEKYPSVIQDLKAWQTAMKSGGKSFAGKLKKFLSIARAHMDKCRSAIPAWIMPLYKVADTLKCEPNIFDVVIVDEASQSGPEALFLRYIAKKIVIVGDSEQISPINVGIDKEQVTALQKIWLKDIPFADFIGIEHSFYDYFNIQYESIHLKEHFRCMPEIIQFSNNLCYASNPLIPLKQFGSGRLNPVVKTIYIPEGYQKGKGANTINPPEAEAIANQIETCCKDEAYSEKTFGVISLRGEYQAKLIQQELMKRIDPDKIEKHQIRCGNAYAFQGDERDVIFLSLVSSPVSESGNNRIGTLSDSDALPYKKSFNVATSRAREQMWLFHSANLNDLSKSCLRYKLLEYCMNPKLEPLVLNGINIDQLRILAKTTHRELGNQPKPFDSWFEVDVFLKIIEKGFRVIPQLKVAGYSIDLVVEGLRNRLAVECDGDECHGPDRYEADMYRQRQLERSGYTFWRIRASVFYLDPDEAMKPLWNVLKEHNIYPEGQEPLPGDPLILPLENENCNNLQDVKILRDEEDKFEPIKSEKNNIDFKNPPIQKQISIININGDHENSVNTPERWLEIYNIWGPKHLVDPRKSSENEILKNLKEIIKEEGPITCARIYRIYARNSNTRVSSIKDSLDSIIQKAIKNKTFVETTFLNLRKWERRTIRLRYMPEVILREKGERDFDEIPSSEIAELMIKILSVENLSQQELYGKILRLYKTRGLEDKWDWLQKIEEKITYNPL
jgi:very-short-patch-repair endonuclease